MGFRKDAYCTVWEVTPKSDSLTQGRISISRKRRDTGEYETDFQGFVSFVGTAAANKALSLKEKDRIKLGDVDVTNKYDKEKNMTYTNYKIFGFEMADATDSSNSRTSMNVEEGDVDESKLPF